MYGCGMSGGVLHYAVCHGTWSNTGGCGGHTQLVATAGLARCIGAPTGRPHPSGRLASGARGACGGGQRGAIRETWSSDATPYLWGWPRVQGRHRHLSRRGPSVGGTGCCGWWSQDLTRARPGGGGGRGWGLGEGGYRLIRGRRLVRHRLWGRTARRWGRAPRRAALRGARDAIQREHLWDLKALSCVQRPRFPWEELRVGEAAESITVQRGHRPTNMPKHAFHLATSGVGRWRWGGRAGRRMWWVWAGGVEGAARPCGRGDMMPARQVAPARAALPGGQHPVQASMREGGVDVHTPGGSDPHAL